MKRLGRKAGELRPLHAEGRSSWRLTAQGIIKTGRETETV